LSESFTCADCGRTIVRIIADPKMPHLCAECLSLPGWFEIAEVAKLLDPAGDANPPKLGEGM
jgi:hypothetical protein